MTLNFYKNLYLGTNLTDEEMANIPYPRYELHYHVMYKTIEMGSILGMWIIGPGIGLIRGRSVAAAVNAGIAGGRIGAGIGVVAGPVMTEMMIRKADKESIYDRSYRIRHNTGQLRTDRFATVGTIVGAGVAPILGSSVLNSGLVGLTVGTMFAGFYNGRVARKTKTPPVTEAVVVKEDKSS